MARILTARFHGAASSGNWMPLDPAGGAELPVFYRGPRAVITDRVVEVTTHHRRCFPVAEMTNVHVVRSTPDRGPFRTYSLFAAVLAIPLAIAVSLPLAAAVVIAAAGCCLWPRAGRWQVRAGYRGAVVTIFTSRDRREFSGFCRGLVRSFEARESLRYGSTDVSGAADCDIAHRAGE